MARDSQVGAGAVEAGRCVPNTSQMSIMLIAEMSWWLLRILTANERGRHALWLTCCCCCLFVWAFSPRKLCLGFLLACSVCAPITAQPCMLDHTTTRKLRQLVMLSELHNDLTTVKVLDLQHIQLCRKYWSYRTVWLFPCLEETVQVGNNHIFFWEVWSLVGVAREITGICCNGVLQVLVNDTIVI